MAHIECRDVTRTALQQAIGKAAGRRSHIQAAMPSGIDREGIQSGGQFVPTARNEGPLPTLQSNDAVGRNPGSRLVDASIVDEYASREDQSLGRAARLGETLANDALVETLTLHAGLLMSGPFRNARYACSGPRSKRPIGSTSSGRLETRR